MDFLWRNALWQQFGATIDMLENALLACPDIHWTAHLWSDQADSPWPPESATFWFAVYHTLFWLDLYLTGEREEEFVPFPPFVPYELGPADMVPERAYSKHELHTYLLHLRQKCQTTIADLTDEQAQRQVDYPWAEGRVVSYLELLLYTMCHVQEHAAQLNLFLGQNGNAGVSGWVPWAKTIEGGAA